MASLHYLTSKLQELIDNRVAQVVQNNGETWREKYTELQYFIDEVLEDGNRLYAESKERGLTAGTIEAEGFVRCAWLIKSKLDQLNNSEDD